MTTVEQDRATRDILMAAVVARRMAGHYQAHELELLAEYARGCDDDDFAHLEVSTLLHISDRAAQQRLRLARELTERLPRTLTALREGKVEEFKAKLIADTVRDLSDEHATVVEDRVLSDAGEQTAGQLRASLVKAVIVADPEGAEERRNEKVRQRRVSAQATEDGQSVLCIYHTSETIDAMRAAITSQARFLRAQPGETRTLEQLEADVAAELVLGSDFEHRSIEVHLTVAATTAAGLDDKPAEVEGVGAVTANAARELMAEAKRWRWIRTDPETGVVVDLTAASYRPPAALAKYIRVRDRTCRFPGCTRPTRACDIDHRTRWPLGETCDANCACLCRRHHRSKHLGHWDYHQLKPGFYRWHSPLGFVHKVTPTPVADSDPDPPPF